MEEKKKRFRPTMIITCLLPVLLFLVVLGLAGRPAPLVLQLKSEQAFLRCGETFDAMKYVGTYSQDATLEVSTAFTSEYPETRIVRYRLLRNEESVEKILRVIVKDESAPELKLKTDYLYLKWDELFEPLSYIDTAYDKVDGNLKAYVQYDFDETSDTFPVHYSVEDFSGNRMEATLTVERAQPSEELQALEQVLEQLQTT